MRFSELIRRIGVASSGGGGGVGTGGRDPEISRVCEDSRKVLPGDLFVARGGTKTSGAKFAADAIAKGAVAIVSDEAIELAGAVPFARVENPNRAMALLAHELAGWPADAIGMIAVTGTKGKTTVAYLVRSILKAAGKTCGMIGTVQIDDGKTIVDADMTTPGAVELAELFARMKQHGTGYCVMETSSHALHQQRLAGLKFSVAMFTNLTGDHLDYHKTMEEYAAAKGLLFEGLDVDATAVVNIDDAWGKNMVRNSKARVLTYSVDQKADWSAKIHGMTMMGTSMDIIDPSGKAHAFTSPLVGKHNVYNTLCAIAGTTAAGISLATVLAGLKEMRGVPGRLQAVMPAADGEKGPGFQVFVDYAHTHDALEKVLTAVRPLTTGRVICVFGCGGDRDRTKRPKMAKVAQDLADRVVVTSDNPRTEQPHAIIEEVCTGFAGDWKRDGKIQVEPDRRAAIGAAIAMAKSGDLVLIAGKGHENYQIIGTTKHHFDDVEEAAAAMKNRRL